MIKSVKRRNGVLEVRFMLAVIRVVVKYGVLNRPRDDGVDAKGNQVERPEKDREKRTRSQESVSVQKVKMIRDTETVKWLTPQGTGKVRVKVRGRKQEFFVLLCLCLTEESAKNTEYCMKPKRRSA